MNFADIMMLVLGTVSGVVLLVGIRYHIKKRKEDCSAINAISVMFLLLFPMLILAFSIVYIINQFIELKADIASTILAVWSFLIFLSLVMIPVISILRCKTVIKAKLISTEMVNRGVRPRLVRYRAAFEYEFEGKSYRCETNTPLLSEEMAEFKVNEEYDIYISEKLPTLIRPWRKLMQYEIYGMIIGAVLLLYCVYTLV